MTTIPSNFPAAAEAANFPALPQPLQTYIRQFVARHRALQLLGAGGVGLASLFETWQARKLNPFDECLKRMGQAAASPTETALPQI